MIMSKQPAECSVAGTAADLDAAVAAYRNAVRLNPAMLPAQLGLCRALRRKGDIDGAMAACREVLRLSPEHAEAAVILEQLRAQKCDRLLGQAKAALAANSLAGAELLCRQLMSINSRSAEGHNALGEVMLRQGDRRQAVAAFQEALRVRPDFPEALLNLGDALSGAGPTLSSSPAPQPLPTKAERRREVPALPRCKPISVAPDIDPRRDSTLTMQDPVASGASEDEKACARRAAAYRRSMQRGNLLASKGNFDGAALAFRQASRLGPNQVKAYNNLGVVLRRQGNLDEALAAFRSAIRLDPGAAEVRNNLGVALRDKGDLAGAIAAWERTVELRPDLAPAWYNLAGGFAAKGEKQKAFESLRQAACLDPACLGKARQDRGLAETCRKLAVNGRDKP